MDFAGGRLLQYLLHIGSANAAARHYLDGGFQRGIQLQVSGELAA
jgi:hypothetical protein